MKLFHLYRTEDLTGVSGTGPVVEGVEFTNGWCALRWITKTSSLCFYQSLEEVKMVHGHGGRTELVIHDFDPLMTQKLPQNRYNQRFEILMQIIEQCSNITVFADDPSHTQATLGAAIANLHSLVRDLENTIINQLPKTA